MNTHHFITCCVHLHIDTNSISIYKLIHGIPEVFRSAIIDEVTSASEFLTEIQKRFTKNNKAETSTHLTSLISMKYQGKGNVREYIIEMSLLASKLKALGSTYLMIWLCIWSLSLSQHNLISSKPVTTVRKRSGISMN